MGVDVQARGAVPDRGPGLLGILWTLTPLAVFTTVLRIVARVRSRMFGWDDVFMLFSTICFIGWSVILTVYEKRGGLEHMVDLEQTGPDNVAMVMFLNWLSQVFGILGVAAGKISVAALLLSIIRLTELELRWQKVLLWVVPVFLAGAIAIAWSTLTFAQCSPARSLWDERIIGHCIKPKVMWSFGTFTGAFNTFADASLAIVPATVIYQLRNTTTEKIQLALVIGLGILTTICSGIKTKYLAALSNRTDRSWAYYDISAWVTGEFFLLIICSSVPALPIVLSWSLATAGSIKSVASLAVESMLQHTTRRRRKNGSRLRSPTGTGNNNEFSDLTHMKIMTKTTIERVEYSQNESVDQLVGGGPPGHGVRVEMMYDVRRDTRPNSLASGYGQPFTTNLNMDKH
ncbi:hypothetical protein PT974_03756 [Cladobotryum mycophilum]|uniref:Rhodopsin domain-containing protein n=1 Tax=Cladobotryum mycophilum TaxID=491253 RepID=A0ABR0ST79_9HYPO